MGQLFIKSFPSTSYGRNSWGEKNEQQRSSRIVKERNDSNETTRTAVFVIISVQRCWCFIIFSPHSLSLSFVKCVLNTYLMRKLHIFSWIFVGVRSMSIGPRFCLSQCWHCHTSSYTENGKVNMYFHLASFAKIPRFDFSKIKSTENKTYLQKMVANIIHCEKIPDSVSFNWSLFRFSSKIQLFLICVRVCCLNLKF